MNEITIEQITAVTDDVVVATERLAHHLGSTNQVTVSPNYLERIVSNPDIIWLMARRTSDDKFVGMALLVITPMLTNVRAYLENVVVDEDARGLGVGSALCTAARDIADKYHVNTLRASASKNNTASKHMLLSAGFLIDNDYDEYALSIHRGPRF